MYGYALICPGRSVAVHVCRVDVVEPLEARGRALRQPLGHRIQERSCEAEGGRIAVERPLTADHQHMVRALRKGREGTARKGHHRHPVALLRLLDDLERLAGRSEIGRASCRESVWRSATGRRWR